MNEGIETSFEAEQTRRRPRVGVIVSVIGVFAVGILLLVWPQSDAAPNQNQNRQSLTPPAELDQPRLGEERPSSLDYQRSLEQDRAGRLQGTAASGVSLPPLETNSALSQPIVTGSSTNVPSVVGLGETGAPASASQQSSVSGPQLSQYNVQTSPPASTAALASIVRGWRPSTSALAQHGTGARFEPAHSNISQENITQEPTVESTDARSESRTVIKAGEIVLGTTVTGANSDVGGQLVVTLLGADLGENRLIGSYTRQGAYLAIQFNLLRSDVSGSTQNVSATAIDLQRLTPEVRTKYRSRWVQRYGLPFVASFFGGFGQAVGQGTSTTTIGAGQSQQVVERDFDLSDQLIISAGAASTNLAQTLGQEAASIQPLVTLDANEPIGVLFLEDVIVSTKAEF